MRDVLATIAHLPAPALQVSDFSSFLAGITHILGVFIGGEEGGRDQPDGDATEGAHDDGLTQLRSLRHSSFFSEYYLDHQATS